MSPVFQPVPLPLSQGGTNQTTTPATGRYVTSDGVSKYTDATESYALAAGHGAWAPSSNATYFWGTFQTLSAGTLAGLAPVFVPRTGRVTRVDLWSAVAGTLGSTESVTLAFRLNDTTDTSLSTSIQYTAIKNGHVAFSGLNVTVAAGDFFEFKQIAPNWVTKPTSIVQSAQILIEVP